ncbi:MAG: hypothetical protein U1F98_03505 [Verrucomicrobiota bacterium]
MNLSSIPFTRGRRQDGSSLFLTLVLAGIALATVAGVLSYALNNMRLTFRSNQYQRALAAAEGTTEKVAALIARDYLSGGEALVAANLNSYRQTTLTSTDSSYWSDWEFNDASGNTGRTYVQLGAATNYVVVNSAFAGLKGYASVYTVVSDAREPGAPLDVTGGVLQQVQLARIPIFQFAMYSTGDMEISCGQPFTITGRVHSNSRLYVEPDNLLTFQSLVTAVQSIQFQRSTNDSRSAPGGSVVYQVPKQTPVPSLLLPIGTTNTPDAVREIVQPPPPLESANSPIGKLRYYNLSDLILVVDDTSVTATSGGFNGFATPIPTNQLYEFVSLTNSFYDARESKTVMPIDINIGALTAWSGTNGSLRPALGSRDLSSVYVWDKRNLAGSQLGAVRLVNGLQLPSRGLTVATARPLYVWGHYNQTNASYLGTNNTSTALPASLVADSVTLLSGNWTDTNSTAAVGSRNATPTTINAALLAGSVESTNGYYGGGMENFPRFLETWGSGNALTYNGSMVKMFPSQYATNMWGKSGVYSPPKRAWAYDINFDNPALLPPLTPSLQWVLRGQWATVPPNQTASTH